MQGILQDFRYALRQLRKDPIFAAVAILTLALAVGANTSIFSVVRAVLLNSLPYRDVHRLVMIWGRNPSRGEKQFPVSAGDFTDWKRHNDVFEDMASSSDNEVTLTGAGVPKFVLGYSLSANYFRLLDVPPILGRTFTDQEADAGTNVTVLSEKLWRTTFHADPEIVGKSITLDAKPFTVIGVMPARFNIPARTELWMPLTTTAVSSDYDHRYIRVLARLREGVSLSHAQTRMDLLEKQIASRHQDTDAGEQTWVEPLTQQIAGDIRTPLLALWGAVGIVLIIACANIAGLLLSRAAGRRAEVSLRVAIGASSFRIVRQFICESLTLSMIGGAVGVVLAVFCTRFLLSIFPNGVANLSIPRIEALPIDAVVLAFALGITILTGVLFGTVPAFFVAKTDASDAMKEYRGSSSGLSSTRTRRALVVSEIAFTLVLLAGGGLMIQSFRNVYQQDLGFQPNRVLGLQVFLPPNLYPDKEPDKQSNFAQNVTDRLNKLPGVEQAAATNFLPLSGFWGTADFTIEGQPAVDKEHKPTADNRVVTPEYFSTMGARLLKGRNFTDLDRSGSERVAIVNSALARHYFGGQDPLNKMLDLGDANHPELWRVVGVVSDMNSFGPEEEQHADLFRPLRQAPSALLAFVIRTSGDPASLLKPAENAIWEVDKDQPIFDATPMSVLATQSVTVRRTSTILLVSFAALALLVAIVGLYGLISYSVLQRTREIGIRIAVGARRGQVLGLIVKQAMGIVVVGEIIGFLIVLIVAHLASSILYGVSPFDPWNLTLAVVAMTSAAMIASYIPARRAMGVDPVEALRAQ